MELPVLQHALMRTWDARAGDDELDIPHYEAIGGLTDGRGYGVLVVDDTTVQLGTSFNSTSVDPLRDEIQFTRSHNLEDGDEVVYETDGGAAIGGLVNGNTYHVKFIDETTIKLLDPSVSPPAAMSFTG